MSGDHRKCLFFARARIERGHTRRVGKHYHVGVVGTDCTFVSLRRLSRANYGRVRTQYSRVVLDVAETAYIRGLERQVATMQNRMHAYHYR